MDRLFPFSSPFITKCELLHIGPLYDYLFLFTYCITIRKFMVSSSFFFYCEEKPNYKYVAAGIYTSDLYGHIVEDLFHIVGVVFSSTFFFYHCC